MAATFTSFTISQPFLGAPLQFFPALGSPELDALIDAYVSGQAPLPAKFSEVTIDFYNNATVDLNTGALVKHYDVYPVFDFDDSLDWGLDSSTASVWDSPPVSLEQSPEQFLAHDFDFGLDSPVIFTPSPSSSASASFSSTDFADFGNTSSFTVSALGSSSTPAKVPARDSVSSGRVTKKYVAKKDSKKAVTADAEARLPGFSIMTKDGVDVTNSAGRGTKTKEQREHAHLMRIMKACDSCKKKKVKCDPSHPRPSASSSSSPQTTDTSMSRTSSSSTSYSPGLIIQHPPSSSFQGLPSHRASSSRATAVPGSQPLFRTSPTAASRQESYFDPGHASVSSWIDKQSPGVHIDRQRATTDPSSSGRGIRTSDLREFSSGNATRTSRTHSDGGDLRRGMISGGLIQRSTSTNVASDSLRQPNTVAKDQRQQSLRGSRVDTAPQPLAHISKSGIYSSPLSSTPVTAPSRLLTTPIATNLSGSTSRVSQNSSSRDSSVTQPAGAENHFSSASTQSTSKSSVASSRTRSLAPTSDQLQRMTLSSSTRVSDSKGALVTERPNPLALTSTPASRTVSSFSNQPSESKRHLALSTSKAPALTATTEQRTKSIFSRRMSKSKVSLSSRNLALTSAPEQRTESSCSSSSNSKGTLKAKTLALTSAQQQPQKASPRSGGKPEKNSSCLQSLVLTSDHLHYRTNPLSEQVKRLTRPSTGGNTKSALLSGHPVLSSISAGFDVLLNSTSWVPAEPKHAGSIRTQAAALFVTICCLTIMQYLFYSDGWRRIDPLGEHGTRAALHVGRQVETWSSESLRTTGGTNPLQLDVQRLLDVL